MEIFHTPPKKENLSLALGFFDGIHKGHKKVIKSAVDFAKKNNLKSAVISFTEHPTCLLLKRNPEYIIPLEDKIKKIENLGVDYLYLLNFDTKFSQMTKEEYFNFLCKYTAPKAITTGFNHYFGKDKQGDTEFLNTVCKKNNIIYKKIEPVKIEGSIVSSSVIRKAVLCADFETAQKMLGYGFYIKGEIIKGESLGTKIGYKTINIEYPPKTIKIPYGVYCTEVEIADNKYKAVTNWGVKPTVSSKRTPITESHIINFEKNIYGQTAKITFLKKIRDEKKFDTLSDLKIQITKDVEFCKNY